MFGGGAELGSLDELAADGLRLFVDTSSEDGDPGEHGKSESQDQAEDRDGMRGSPPGRVLDDENVLRRAKHNTEAEDYRSPFAGGCAAGVELHGADARQLQIAAGPPFGELVGISRQDGRENDAGGGHHESGIAGRAVDVDELRANLHYVGIVLALHGLRSGEDEWGDGRAGLQRLKDSLLEGGRVSSRGGGKANDVDLLAESQGPFLRSRGTEPAEIIMNAQQVPGPVEGDAALHMNAMKELSSGVKAQQFVDAANRESEGIGRGRIFDLQGGQRRQEKAHAHELSILGDERRDVGMN